MEREISRGTGIGSLKNCNRSSLGKPKRRLEPILTHKTVPEIDFRHYDRIKPGIYRAYCRLVTRYFDHGFKRWVCLLLWDVHGPDPGTVIASIAWWMSLGAKEKPRAARRGKYFKEWVKANGAPPARGDRLSPHVFLHRMAQVEVGDTDQAKSPAPYSVVRNVLSWETVLFSGH